MASTGGSLRRYVLTRLLLAAPMVLILLTLVFLLMRVAPGNPIVAALGGHLSPQQLAARERAAGYDKPLIVQYWQYLQQVFTGNLGTTLTDHRPVTQVIAQNGAATLELTVSAMFVAVSVGVPLGLLAGRYRNTWFDAGSRIFGIVIYAAPVFFLGLLAQLLFSHELGWLPASSEANVLTQANLQPHTNILIIDAMIDNQWNAIPDLLAHLVLPAVTLGLVIAGVIVRLVRVNVIQSLRSDSVEAARARGLSERRVLVNHAFRNALVPIVTVTGLQVALLLSGAVLTEETFNWPGIGNQLVNYLENRDYIAVQGIVTVFALAVVVISVLIDVVNAFIDPRGAVLMPDEPVVVRRYADAISRTGADTVRAGSPSPRRLPRLRRVIDPLLAARGLARWLLIVGGAITLAFLTMAAFASLIAPYGFNQYQSGSVRFPQQGAPSGVHWFGTTVQSEDVFSRVIFGAQTSLEVVVLSLVLSLVIGVPLGLVSGYFGGWFDRVLVLLNDSIFAFPYLLLAIVIAFLLQGSVSGVLTAAIAITAVYIPQYFRVIRNSVLSVREEPYVEAGRSLGAKPRTVIRRYVFQNVVQSVPVVASLNAADAILTLAALSFLGIGIDPSAAAEWGYDVSRGIADAQAGFWWTGLFPGLAIVLMVTGFTLLGEGLNDTLNPLLRTPSRARHHLGARASMRALGRSHRDRTRLDGTTRESRPDDEPVVSLENLRVYYATDRGDVRAVDGVSLKIGRGQTVGLVGESGSGKSTMGRGILGLVPAGTQLNGVVRFGGSNLLEATGAELRHLRGSSIGLVFQEPMTRLDPLMRISEHFAEVLKSHEPRIRADEVERRSLEVLGAVGIPPTRFHLYPHEFSGGMRQRILIALALVVRPKLLIADEPTTALDVLVEAQIMSILSSLKRDFDLALLLITHNLGIVAESCDRVAVMYAGRIVEQGTVEDVFAEPLHPYTQELLASTISLTTRELHSIPGAPPDLVDPPNGCRFHPRCPHAMRICREEQPPDEGVAGGRAVECWLHVPDGQIPPGMERPLAREEIDVVDEA